jgi:hypothetical protein
MISQKLCSASFLEYLAKTTTRSKFISIAYIVFITKMQKEQTHEKGFALVEKRYHTIFEALIFTPL